LIHHPQVNLLFTHSCRIYYLWRVYVEFTSASTFSNMTYVSRSTMLAVSVRIWWESLRRTLSQLYCGMSLAVRLRFRQRPETGSCTARRFRLAVLYSTRPQFGSKSSIEVKWE